MAIEEMYYRRVISDELKQLLLKEGAFHWLYQLVKARDFLIGANKSKQWIYVYRGTTRLLDITEKRGLVKVSANRKYLDLAERNNLNIYGVKKVSDLNFRDDFVRLISCLGQDKKLDRHFVNKKEGYFQNLFSRQFGICAKGTEDFVVVDKEAVIGFENKGIKAKYFGEQRKRFMKINQYLSRVAPKRYGSKLNEKALGNELDFLAVGRNGEILLVEFKHGSSTKGIYLSPIQIGLYLSLFQDYISRYQQDFIRNIEDMIKQKKDMGLIPESFPTASPNGSLVPVLIIAEYNPISSAMDKFKSVLKICREEIDGGFLSELRIFNYSENGKLTPITVI
jgi:hypothetical protein